MSATSAAHCGAWISLMDYATKNGVSLSTLRRYIKADKIKHHLEHGRYLIWDESASPSIASDDSGASLIKKLQEENAELKTLVAFYEEHLFKTSGNEMGSEIHNETQSEKAAHTL